MYLPPLGIDLDALIGVVERLAELLELAEGGASVGEKHVIVRFEGDAGRVVFHRFFEFFRAQRLVARLFAVVARRHCVRLFKSVSLDFPLVFSKRRTRV